eukprot:GEMP01038132.1.p1 GENE.GEMP01038132.1~~GEMP01038132.1.p1  ORF type:complete len:251 (+),score=43.38 GEMP01038132.1:146-898(+)
MRSVRLGDLCRRFGVAYDCTPHELKSAFHRQCKTIHPDRSTTAVPDATNFIKLREEYEMALRLRTLGYFGVDRTDTRPWQDISETSSCRYTNPRHGHWVPHLNQQQRAATAVPYYTPFGQQDDVIRVFDMQTRIKGTCIVVFGTIFLLLALREFLVATAGSFWMYKPPNAWSNFYIRRYFNKRWDDQNEDVKQKCTVTRKHSRQSDFYERRLHKSGMCREEKDRICRVRKKLSRPRSDSEEPPEESSSSR